MKKTRGKNLKLTCDMANNLVFFPKTSGEAVTKTMMPLSTWLFADEKKTGKKISRDTAIRWLKTGVLKGKLVKSETKQIGRWLVATPPNKRESVPANRGRRRSEMAKKIAAKLINAFVATCETCGKQETKIYESKREARYTFAARLAQGGWIVNDDEKLVCGLKK